MRSFLLGLAFFFVFQSLLAQESSEEKQIQIVYGGTFSKDEARYPGASIFSRDDEKQVQFEHQGADLWCDVAIFYPKENKLRAIGQVRLQQGDSVEMNSRQVHYDGNTRLAKSFGKVELTKAEMTLYTDTLFFDRAAQKAYYRSGGKIVDPENTLTSIIGTYFMEVEKYQFRDSVHIDNADYTIDSKQMDYYTISKNAYMKGPSTIRGEDYTMYCERGFYDTKIEQGYGVKNTKIFYDNRIIEGDSVYFDKASEFASATNNIQVTDTVNNGVVRAHYAEVFKAMDSVFATKRAVAINLIEKDSLFIHGDTLMVTGLPDERVIRAFRKARFFKTDLAGKCDSIHFEQKTGVTELVRDPIMWNAENQMTGDSIYLISDLETEKLDSLKVINNAFVIALDTVGKAGYNQAKGKDLFGKFEDNVLKDIELVKNTEVIYYMYDDKQDLIGIDKTICSRIRLHMLNNTIDEITFFINPDGNIFPEKDLPVESRKLKGFIWRGDERLRTKDDIFDEDDNTIQLVSIRGIDDAVDIDKEERERSTSLPIPKNKGGKSTTTGQEE